MCPVNPPLHFIRALAALAVAAVSLVVLGPAPATAAPVDCRATSLAESARAADTVFTGTVTEVGRSGGEGPGDALFGNEVDVDRIYKGRGDAAQVQVVTRSDSQRRPGLGALERDGTYLFFADLADGVVTADGCSGTRVADDALVQRLERVLGEGRPAVPPPPIEAEFTEVAESEPMSFSRAAAPGAALVLIGLLGLVLVGRVSRRS